MATKQILNLKTTTLLEDNREGDIIREGKERLEKYKFSDKEIDYFEDRIAGVLDDYARKFGVCVIFKAIKSRLVTGIPIGKLLKTFWPAIRTALTTASTSALISQVYDCAKQLNVKEDYISFWVPMCSAMCALKT